MKLGLLKRVWDKFGILIGLAIFVIFAGNCVSCFALPSLIHQPSASYLYEWTFNSPYAAHSTDRAIARAAGCFGYPGSKDFVEENNTAMPHWRYDSRIRAAMLLAKINAPESLQVWLVSDDSDTEQRSYRRRREGIGRAIVNSGLALSREEASTARWLRAAHRSGELDLNGLKAKVEAEC